MSTSTPSIETIAGLYAAALRLQDEGNRAVRLVRESIARHGYAEEAVLKEAARVMLNDTCSVCDGGPGNNCACSCSPESKIPLR